ncbi:hypothetical protein ACEE08_11220 [Staphylococcus rostri]
MTKDNNKQYKPKDPGHRGGGGAGHEKRNNDPARKSYNNHTTEFERPSESKIDALFGKNKKKKK